jgi:DMSO/TMAO reductase YedYZ molybdopterin-dependent catalytic subunit
MDYPFFATNLLQGVSLWFGIDGTISYSILAGFALGEAAMRSGISSIARITRRAFMKLTSGTALLTSKLSAASGLYVKALPVRTVEKKGFRFYAEDGSIEWKNKKEPYRLVVDGLVKEPRSFSYPDIKSFTKAEQMSDFHCVEGWSVRDLKWGGFKFKEILDRIELIRDATYVLFHSLGMTEASPGGQSHYIESFPLSELIGPEREILLALTLNYRPLLEENGAPLRLIAPYDLGYKSIKFISRIEFIKGERPGWWTLANPMYTTVARVPKTRLRRK